MADDRVRWFFVELLTPDYTGHNMRDTQIDLELLKQRMRDTWMAGDFGQIAQYSAKGGEEFVTRLAISRGMRVLDVACGTGNLAVPAARTGAQVTGVDIAPNLLEQARQRAAGQGLLATFEEGDAEQLAYPDGQFDVVMSMFGAMFAPRPERVSSELARVCRQGGTIAMANWTPEGFVGKMFSLTSRYVPAPSGIPSPVLWGIEEVAKERFAAYATKTEAVRRAIIFDCPFPPKQVVQFFRDYFGPTQMAFSRLDAAGQSALAAELEKLWSEHNRGEQERTLVSAEYLEVVATRV
jgi:ubiquinone/menaquinone biosynthesis C-methylase UbiE